MSQGKKKVAIVIGSLPSVEEVDQFRLIEEAFDVSVISSESICGYLSANSFFENLGCIALADHDENPSFLPGLEQALTSFDVVVIKERLGLYAYQALKAKWRHRFRLLVWVDNLNSFPAEDIDQMRTIRQEVCATADGFLVQSRAARNMLELEGIESDRIHDMKPWVQTQIEREPKARAKARSQLGLSESDLIISYLGQIEWEEGLKDLVVAAKILTSRTPSLKDRLRIVVCGIGSYGTELSALFRQMDIEDCAVYYAPSRESLTAILQATDAIYLATMPSRDRVEGDPYRILLPMTNGIPVIASRNPIIEELCGKHRIDFCSHSPDSLAKAINKLQKAPGLVNNIINKNLADVKNRFDQEKIRKGMLDIFGKFAVQELAIDEGCLDHQVLEAEAKIKAQKYLEAIDIVESIFRTEKVPLHHRANLYRLIGDCFVKLGDLESAKNAYFHGTEIDPYSARLYIGLGTVSLMKESFDLAVPHFQKAVSLAPEDEMANLGLGLAFQGIGELKESSRWVAKTLDVNPMNSAAVFTFVKLSHLLDEYEECEHVLRRFLRSNPNDPNIMYSLGGVLFKLGRYEEVCNLMDLILANDSEDPRAFELLNEAKSAIKQAQSSSSSG